MRTFRPFEQPSKAILPSARQTLRSSNTVKRLKTGLSATTTLVEIDPLPELGRLDRSLRCVRIRFPAACTAYRAAAGSLDRPNHVGRRRNR
jgi:hypothetical protein